jgi:hypothetical protein
MTLGLLLTPVSSCARGTTGQNVLEAHPPRAITKTRRPRPLRSPRSTPDDGHLVPDSARDVVEEVVEDGEDPRGQVQESEDKLRSVPSRSQLATRQCRGGFHGGKEDRGGGVQDSQRREQSMFRRSSSEMGVSSTTPCPSIWQYEFIRCFQTRRLCGRSKQSFSALNDDSPTIGCAQRRIRSISQAMECGVHVRVRSGLQNIWTTQPGTRI